MSKQKAICTVTNERWLTEDKIYKIEHIYNANKEEALVLNDKGFYKYYPLTYFKPLIYSV